MVGDYLENSVSDGGVSIKITIMVKMVNGRCVATATGDKSPNLIRGQWCITNELGERLSYRYRSSGNTPGRWFGL